MNKKIYIKKQKVDIRIMLCAVFMFFVWIVRDIFLDRGYSLISTNMKILATVVFLFVLYIFLFLSSARKNTMIRTGKLIWCKVDRSRCQNNVAGIVIRGGYFWEDTKMFIEYTGSVRTTLDSRRDEYVQIMEKVKYVPVFVDLLDRNNYTMVLSDLWTRPEEEDKRSKDVIRIIDNHLYKKQSDASENNLQLPDAQQD